MITVYVIVENPPEIHASIVGRLGYVNRDDAERHADEVPFGSVKEVRIQE